MVRNRLPLQKKAFHLSAFLAYLLPLLGHSPRPNMYVDAKAAGLVDDPVAGALASHMGAGCSLMLYDSVQTRNGAGVKSSVVVPG